MSDKVKDFEFYKTFYENVAIHVKAIATDKMREHAWASEDHDLDFQIFRLLQGYNELIESCNEIRFSIRDLILEDIEKLTDNECAKLYKHIRSEYIAEV